MDPRERYLFAGKLSQMAQNEANYNIQDIEEEEMNENYKPMDNN